MPSPRPRPRPVSRRATLLGPVGGLGGLAVVALVGCDADDLRPPDADAPVAPSASTPGAPTADEALVDEAVTAIQAAAATVVAARRVRVLRGPLSSLLRDHRRHLSALDGQEGSTVVPPPADETSARAAVGAAEKTLHQQLVDLAVRAESGTLAALLASMSASIAQHVATSGVTA